jgi:virginiamycin B lyase
MIRLLTLASCLLLTAAPAFAQQGGAGLPEGAGKSAVEQTCASCHPVSQIMISAGYTRAGWEELIDSMVDLSGRAQTKSEILDYLAAHAAPNDLRKSTLVPGPLEVTFREWVTPQLGTRARDPVEAPDGKYWFVGQMGNTIGRIDPATDKVEEWPLPPRALPHSVNVDRDGGVWYTGNGNGTIGKFDPATGKSTEYRMPDPAARDPHTAEFDPAGILWFTLQQSNMVGRFDPKTGDIRLATMKTPRSRPYGIKVAKDGTLWIACNGSNCIARMDPATMEITEIKLPNDATTVRRLDIDDAGVIWYVNSSQGKLGRYDPATGAIKEWDSPSGSRSHPYAIAVIDNKVWYNESAMRPDPLVRFDPVTETFQSWAIPSGGIYAGLVRHMRATKSGDLLLHQGSTNRVILATLPKDQPSRIQP